MSSNNNNKNLSASSSSQSLISNTSSDEDLFKSEPRSRRKTRRGARLRVNPSGTKIRVKTSQAKRDADNNNLETGSESEDEVFSSQSAAGWL